MCWLPRAVGVDSRTVPRPARVSRGITRISQAVHRCSLERTSRARKSSCCGCRRTCYSQDVPGWQRCLQLAGAAMLSCTHSNLDVRGAECRIPSAQAGHSATRDSCQSAAAHKHIARPAGKARSVAHSFTLRIMGRFCPVTLACLSRCLLPLSSQTPFSGHPAFKRSLCYLQWQQSWCGSLAVRSLSGGPEASPQPGVYLTAVLSLLELGTVFFCDPYLYCQLTCDF